MNSSQIDEIVPLIDHGEVGKLRIASLQPSVTVTLADLGELGQLVACTKYCAEICPEVVSAGKKIIQDSWTAKADEIIDARPDLVIASVPYQKEAVAQIIRAGIRFLGLAPHCLADVYEDIRIIARVAGAAVRGEQVIREMQWAVSEVRRATMFYPKKRMFCEEWGKPLIHSQRWVAELVDAVGGEFLGEPGAQTTAEAIRAMDPEVVIAA